jgi:hypothetical protein
VFQGCVIELVVMNMVEAVITWLANMLPDILDALEKEKSEAGIKMRLNF